MRPHGRRVDIDVVVVGGGPAAWAIAAACAAQDLTVTIVTADPDARWPATYGVWVDDLDGVLAEPVVARCWDRVVVRADAERALTVVRAYGLLDNDALAASLRRAAGAAGVRAVRGEVAGAAPDAHGAVVVTRAGVVLTGRAVVDASGWPAALVAAPRAPAWQVAHGIVARTDRPMVEPGTCTLMDWTTVAGEPDPQPSFLYALDLGDGRALLEETVLAAARPLAPAVLARRLARRLEAAGVRVVATDRVESVRIPMGLAAPAATNQVAIGFGAAAGLIHPATGYSVAASLRAAPRLATALAAARRRGARPDAITAAGWDAVWPHGRRRARALERYGFDALVRMDQRALAEFFATFFALPAPAWSGYLAGTLDARSTVALMGQVFAAAPWSLRRHLAAPDPRWLWRALRP